MHHRAYGAGKARNWAFSRLVPVELYGDDPFARFA
jgi:hypothetical protein